MGKILSSQMTGNWIGIITLCTSRSEEHIALKNNAGKIIWLISQIKTVIRHLCYLASCHSYFVAGKNNSKMIWTGPMPSFGWNLKDMNRKYRYFFRHHVQINLFQGFQVSAVLLWRWKEEVLLLEQTLILRHYRTSDNSPWVLGKNGTVIV